MRPDFWARPGNHEKQDIRKNQRYPEIWEKRRIQETRAIRQLGGTWKFGISMLYKKHDIRKRSHPDAHIRSHDNAHIRIHINITSARAVDRDFSYDYLWLCYDFIWFSFDFLVLYDFVWFSYDFIWF